MKELPEPYRDVARVYDAEFEHAQADIAGYARRGVPGRLLVLGCGTGRVSHALADHRPVVGLDRSPSMLARARARGGPVDYQLGDLRSFDLGSFDEVILPNAAFSFLLTRADQLACLVGVSRTLPSGAPLTLDLPMPDFSLLGTAHSPERPAWTGLVDGEEWHRTREVFRLPVAQRLSLVDRYYAGGGLRHVSTLELRLVFPAELEWICEAAGFWVDAWWGDHAGGPIREGCDRLLVRAIRM